MQEPRKDSETYRRLFSYTKNKRWWFFVVVFGSILYAGSNAIYTDILKQIIDYIANNGVIDSIIPKPDFIDTRTFIVSLIVIVSIARGFGSFLSVFGVANISGFVVYSIRNQVHSHYLNMDSKYFDSNNSGKLISTVSFTADQVSSSVSDSLLVVVRESIVSVVLFSLMVFYSWKLTLLFISVLPIIIVFLVVAGKYFRNLSKKIQGGMGNITHLVSEIVSGNIIVKVFQSQKFERERFKKKNKIFLSHNIKNALVQSISVPVIQVSIALVNAIVVWFALSNDFVDTMSAGSFVSFFIAAGLLARPFKQLSEVNRIIQKGLAASQEIFQLLDCKTEEIHKGKVSITSASGRFEFKDVSFAYTDSDNVIKKLNFSTNPGDTVALVGRSGSGKTTLANLLMRIHKHTKGEILLDGIELGEISIHSLRNQMAFITQSNFLFNDTILNNVIYGSDDKENEETIKKARFALLQANALEFVDSLSSGMYSIVGENGISLSGGQIQRISIARAFYKDAPILILDEATSALDSESEKLIQISIKKLTKNKTTFIITHKVNSVFDADLILVLDKGEIVQSGTHTELCKKENGIYLSLLTNMETIVSASKNNNVIEPEIKNKKDGGFFVKFKESWKKFM